MDEGDDYVPQMQIAQMGDYGSMGGPMGGMGGPGPSVPSGYPSMGMGMSSAMGSNMSSGLTPMTNPYEQQHMMMLGGPPQQQAPPVAPPPAKATKSRSKKKDKQAAQQQQQSQMDPMQSMAAMSNNPMMRPSMQPMGANPAMYPQQNRLDIYSQQGNQYPPNAAYRGAPQYPQQSPYGMQPMYPTQRQGHAAPPNYAQGQPSQQQASYPNYPPGYPQGASHPQQYPGIRPPYPGNQQQQMSMQGGPGPGQYWDQQSPYYPEQHHQGSMPGMSHENHQQQQQWAMQLKQQLYQCEMEVRSLGPRLQQMYNQPRTPMLEQEIQQMQQRMQYLQTEGHRIQQQLQQLHASSQAGHQQMSAQQNMPSAQTQPHQTTQITPSSMPPPSQTGMTPHSNQQQSMHTPTQSTPATPVQVTQCGSQVQVNINPEPSGRTLISVYHERNGSTDQAFEEQKDSVPPEPIPTTSHPQQMPIAHQQQGVPSSAHGASQQPQSQQQQPNQQQAYNQMAATSSHQAATSYPGQPQQIQQQRMSASMSGPSPMNGVENGYPNKPYGMNGPSPYHQQQPHPGMHPGSNSGMPPTHMGGQAMQSQGAHMAMKPQQQQPSGPMGPQADVHGAIVSPYDSYGSSQQHAAMQNHAQSLPPKTPQTPMSQPTMPHSVPQPLMQQQQQQPQLAPAPSEFMPPVDIKPVLNVKAEPEASSEPSTAYNEAIPTTSSQQPLNVFPPMQRDNAPLGNASEFNDLPTPPMRIEPTTEETPQVDETPVSEIKTEATEEVEATFSKEEEKEDTEEKDEKEEEAEQPSTSAVETKTEEPAAQSSPMSQYSRQNSTAATGGGGCLFYEDDDDEDEQEEPSAQAEPEPETWSSSNDSDAAARKDVDDETDAGTSQAPAEIERMDISETVVEHEDEESTSAQPTEEAPEEESQPPQSSSVQSESKPSPAAEIEVAEEESTEVAAEEETEPVKEEEDQEDQEEEDKPSVATEDDPEVKPEEPTEEPEEPAPEEEPEPEPEPTPSEVADSVGGCFTEPATPSQVVEEKPAVQSSKRGGSRKASAPKGGSRKKKVLDDSGDDDDDFMPEVKPRKSVKWSKSSNASAASTPAESPAVSELKRSASSKWESADGEEDEEEDSILTTDSTEARPDLPVVEKILSVRIREKSSNGERSTESKDEKKDDDDDEEKLVIKDDVTENDKDANGEKKTEEDKDAAEAKDEKTSTETKSDDSDSADAEEEFLIKWKNKAYIHCEWKTLKELEEIDKRVLNKVKRFKMKKMNAVQDEDEDFNSDFTIVERVIDIATGDDGIAYALIKWKSLAYDEVTWEPLDTIEKDKIDIFKKRQKLDKYKLKEKNRPKATEWKKIPEDMVWKNDNELREYQFEGVNWLLYCYYNQQNCILADEMGLGKTVQTITFLSQVYEYGIHGPFLIVVPLSTIHNWVREFETWTDMNAVVYHGSAKAREIIQQHEVYYSKDHSGNNKSWRKNLVKLDALITTFEMVITDCEFLRKIPYRVCIIDEAHRLKNRNSKLLTGGLHAFRMEHRVLLTGTPLQNNIEELFSLLNFLHPLQFNSSTDFLEQFGQCKTDDQVQKLQEILRPMMLRRLKEDVEKSLIPKEETIIEVQLSDIQKKYYRAILERNFSHLCKGMTRTSAPSLMNVMMELRKCCNHPFLIQGAEETILSEMRVLHPDWDEETLSQKALIQSAGKVVLIEKLLPKLKKDGHKVLIFSQMVKVLDLLEEFLINMNYTFERIDGNVRGDLRQQSIDRFSKKDSDRFVFLLCTRAGGLGINLTAADTVIIFDSDWNPQNDLQAQARCHRIGQTKMVKVYRLVTANTYEREMFDKASMKLGLDKAVLQSTTALKEASTALSKKDVEELLKKGAYGSIMDETNEGSKFSEEDIETILQRRTHTITLETGQKGSLFAKATFNSTHNRGDDIDIDDPNFWTKWAEKAQVDIEKATANPDGRELILEEPRKRTKRFEENSLKEGEDSDGSSESGRGARKRGANAANAASTSRKRRRGDEEDGDYVSYRPDELAFNKSEFFKVEKVLAQFGWGRWADMKKTGELEVSELDIEHMSRVLLLHCVREYRGDERIRQLVWQLICPQGVKTPKESKANSAHSIYHQGWAALPEYNPPNFALDASFQRHVHRHANKLLVKIDQMKHIEKEMLGDKCKEVLEGASYSSLYLPLIPQLTDTVCPKWNHDCDKSLIIGVYKHGIDNYDMLKDDATLVFESLKLDPFPGAAELGARFRRLVAISQRNTQDPVYEKQKWSKREEQEFMRILRSFGMKDKTTGTLAINWAIYREMSPALEKKTDEDMQEHLYCILAMCTKVQGGELSPLDLKRALSVEAMSMKKAQKLMARLHLTRKLHAIVAAGLDILTPTLKLCAFDAMPSGWTTQHDKDLLTVCDDHGIDTISTNVLQKPSFQKIIRPTEKVLLRRVLEVCTTVETGKWNGTASIESLEDSDMEEAPAPVKAVATTRTPASGSSSSRRSRKRAADTESAKMRALMQQTMLSQLTQLGSMGTSSNDASMNTATMAALLQSALLMPQLLGGSTSSASTSSSAASQQQNAAMLASLLALSQMTSPTASSSASTSSANAQAQQQAAALATMMSLGLLSDPSVAAAATSSFSSSDAVNLSKKASTSSTPAPAPPTPVPVPTPASVATAASTPTPTPTATATATASATPSNLNQLGLQELIILASLPSDTRIPVMNMQTKERLMGDQAPKLKNLSAWMSAHPSYVLDLASLGAPPTSTPSTSSATARSSAAATAAAIRSKSSTPAPAASTSVIGVARTPAATPNPLVESTPSSAKPSAPPTPRPIVASAETRSTTATPALVAPAATPKLEASPKLEPGEIPKKASTTTSSAATAAANAAAASAMLGLQQSDAPVAVFSRSTGSLLPAARWPMLSQLATWLEANRDCNVHSSCVGSALAVVGLTHADRLGGETLITPAALTAAQAPTTSISKASEKQSSASASAAAAAAAASAAAANAAMTDLTKQQLEALQLQMLMQQSLMQQALLSSAYSVNPYSALGASVVPTSSSSKNDDALNAQLLMASMLSSNPSLLMMDPTMLALLAASSTPTSSSSGATSSKRTKNS